MAGPIVSGVAIRPGPPYAASRRVRLLARLQGTTGLASVIIGLGPLIEDGAAAERAAGGVGIAVGALMVVSATVIVLSRGPVRIAGFVGGAATVALGLVVVVLAASSVGTCHVANRPPLPCYLVIGAVAAVGATLVGMGGMSIASVSRARLELFRRARR